MLGYVPIRYVLGECVCRVCVDVCVRMCVCRGMCVCRCVYRGVQVCDMSHSTVQDPRPASPCLPERGVLLPEDSKDIS